MASLGPCGHHPLKFQATHTYEFSHIEFWNANKSPPSIRPTPEPYIAIYTEAIGYQRLFVFLSFFALGFLAPVLVSESSLFLLEDLGGSLPSSVRAPSFFSYFLAFLTVGGFFPFRWGGGTGRMKLQTAHDSSSGPCLRFQSASVSAPGPQQNHRASGPGSSKQTDIFVCLIWAPDAYVALFIAAVASATNLGSRLQTRPGKRWSQDGSSNHTIFNIWRLTSWQYRGDCAYIKNIYIYIHHINVRICK